MTTRKIMWEPGAAYHVTTRGNRKDIIFRDDDDFKTYLRILKNNLKYYEEFNYQLGAYCLMSNHVHLIIKTDKEPLTRFMSRLNSMYTKYFNKRYDYVGHLFQGRYFAKYIKSDIQMLEISKYIHLNPVKAKIVEQPYEYKWSTYLMLIGKTRSSFITQNIVLDYFKYERRFQLYEQFVIEASPDTPGVS